MMGGWDGYATDDYTEMTMDGLYQQIKALTAEVERLREGLTTILNKAEAGRTTLPGMVDMVVKVLHPVEGGQG